MEDGKRNLRARNHNCWIYSMRDQYQWRLPSRQGYSRELIMSRTKKRMTLEHRPPLWFLVKEGRTGERKRRIGENSVDKRVVFDLDRNCKEAKIELATSRVEGINE